MAGRDRGRRGGRDRGLVPDQQAAGRQNLGGLGDGGRSSSSNVVNRPGAVTSEGPPIDCDSWSMTEVGSVKKGTFVWKIKGFKDNRETYKLNPLLSEDYFITGDDGSPKKWNLEVQPDVSGGYSRYDNYGSYVTVSNVNILVHSKNWKNLNVKMDVSILNNEKVRARTSSKTHTFSNGSSVTVMSISWDDDLHTNADTLMPDGDLTIVCDLSLLGSVENSSVETIKGKELILRKSLEILAKDLTEFYLSKEMSDVQIKCGNQTFDGHKFILSARSPVFSRMLQSEMKEKRSGLVDLGDASPDMVSELLKFIYTGSCCVNDKEPDPQIVCELLQAADKYELENLKEMCQYALISTLNWDNSMQYFALGDMYEAQLLKKRALNMIVRKKKKIMGTEEWKDCAKKRPHLIVEIAEAMAGGD